MQLGTVVTSSQLRHRVGAAFAVVVGLASADAGFAATAEAGGPALRIASPSPGSTIATTGARKARSAVVVAARARVATKLRRLSVRLNGQEVSPRSRSGRVIRAQLSAADGLRPGVNRLRVEATRKGAKVPLNAVSQFTVTYPSERLIRLSSSKGRAGAASSRLHMPRSGLLTLSMVLNGTDVRSALSQRVEADGSRRLELSAAHPLRWGRNTLAVRAVMYDGRTQTVRRTFRRDRRKNIAGLELRSAAHVGRRVRLDAGASRVVTGRLSPLRWRLVRRPANSRVAISAHGRRAKFTPDVPGTYRIRVRVGSGAAADSTTLSVTATYPDVLVPVNSIDDGTPSALAIGGTRYPVTGGLQVNVFERASLGFVEGQGFDTTSSGISALGAYLEKWDDSHLVFVTHPSTSPAISYSDHAALNTALGHIGGSYPGYWQLNDSNTSENDAEPCWAGQTERCEGNTATKTGWVDHASAAIGSFSVAGVPGMSAGQAWRATAAQTRSSEGRISGYLTQGVPAQTGSVNSYAIVAGADQYAQVDTCAEGGPSQCVIRVGDQTFAPDPGANGFNVVILDRTTLAPIHHTTATTPDELIAAISYDSGSLQMGRRMPLRGVDDQRILVLQSVGTGILPFGDNLYPYIDWFGGTPELFYSTIVTGLNPYAMVGVADELPWHGTASESSPLASGTSSGKQTGRVRTVLSRNRNWLYTPTAGDPYGQTNLDLYTVMYQDPMPWSYEGDPAVAYIGAELYLPADVRSAYINANVDFASKAAILASLTCTDTEACGSNFDAVKKQLLDEFDWVQSTRSLVANLQYPFVVDQQSQPLNVQDVYDEVSATVKPPPGETTSFDFLSVFLEVTDLAQAVAFVTGFDDAGNALGLISAGGEFSSDSTSAANGDSTDTLRGEVQDLDEQLANQQLAYVEALDRLGAVIVQDAGKLQTVGVSVGTDPAWNWSEGTSLSESITALNAGSRSSSYAALLPPTWSVFNLITLGQESWPPDNVKTYECASYDYGPEAIFADALPANQLHAATYANPVWLEVWTFTNIKTDDFYMHPSKYVTVPSKSLTDNLTSTNTQSGAFQYLPQWLRTTYSPPGGVDCTPIPGSSVASLAWDPPVIPHADDPGND